MIVVVGRQHLQQLSDFNRLEQKFKRSRTFTIEDPQLNLEVSTIMNLGNQWIAMNLPYHTDTIPHELKTCRRIKVLIPSEYFKDLHRKIILTDFMRYDSTHEAEQLLSRDNDPTVFNILVTT